MSCLRVICLKPASAILPTKNSPLFMLSLYRLLRSSEKGDLETRHLCLGQMEKWWRVL